MSSNLVHRVGWSNCWVIKALLVIRILNQIMTKQHSNWAALKFKLVRKASPISFPEWIREIPSNDSASDPFRYRNRIRWRAKIPQYQLWMPTSWIDKLNSTTCRRPRQWWRQRWLASKWHRTTRHKEVRTLQASTNSSTLLTEAPIFSVNPIFQS